MRDVVVIRASNPRWDDCAGFQDTSAATYRTGPGAVSVTRLNTTGLSVTVDARRDPVLDEATGQFVGEATSTLANTTLLCLPHQETAAALPDAAASAPAGDQHGARKVAAVAVGSALAALFIVGTLTAWLVVRSARRAALARRKDPESARGKDAGSARGEGAGGACGEGAKKSCCAKPKARPGAADDLAYSCALCLCRGACLCPRDAECPGAWMRERQPAGPHAAQDASASCMALGEGLDGPGAGASRSKSLPAWEHSAGGDARGPDARGRRTSEDGGRGMHAVMSLQDVLRARSAQQARPPRRRPRSRRRPGLGARGGLGARACMHAPAGACA